MISKPEILFVDDSKTVRQLAQKILSEKYTVQVCSDGDEAWATLRATLSIKMVFTDIQMQGMDGTVLLKNIRESSNARIAAMPVVMITGTSDTEATMRKVFELGATDFIAKPFKSMDLLSRAYSYIKLSEQVNSLEQRLGLDKLTGLANKVSMRQHAVKFLASAHRHHTPFSVSYLDVIGFDEIIDTYGNRIATQILSAIAKRISLKVRSEDVACRIGTSRFAILLPMCSSEKAKVSTNRIIDDIHKIPFKLSGERLHVDVVAGISSTDVNDSKVSIDGMLSQVDQSVSIALQEGGSNLIVYNESSSMVKGKKEVGKIEMTESINDILEGRFLKVPKSHANVIRKKMQEFFDYRDSI